MRRTKHNPSRAERASGFYLPDTILPAGIDGRTRLGKRVKIYAAELAAQTPGSDSPLIRSKILIVALLHAKAEEMVWRGVEGKPIDIALLASISRAIHYNEGQLQGKGQGAGRPKTHGRYAGFQTAPTLRRAMGGLN